MPWGKHCVPLYRLLSTVMPYHELIARKLFYEVSRNNSLLSVFGTTDELQPFTWYSEADWVKLADQTALSSNAFQIPV